VPDGDGKLVLLERHSLFEANEGANIALTQRTAFGIRDMLRRDVIGLVMRDPGLDHIRRGATAESAASTAPIVGCL
jgi:hypothetical protein